MNYENLRISEYIKYKIIEEGNKDMNLNSASNYLEISKESNIINDLKQRFPEAFLKVAVVGKGAMFMTYKEALVEAINKFGFEAKGFDHIEYDYHPDVFLIINPFHFINEDFRYNNFIYAGIQTEQIHNDEVYCIQMGLPNYKKLLKSMI